MNLLERIEQRVLFERLVIGLEEPVLVKGIGEISAKVDSGNGGFNVLHGTDLYQEGDMLHFKTVDGQGQVKQVATKVVDRIEVNIGGGHIQDRPVVELDIKFANTLYKKIPFSITDRGDNDNKILICKQFVEDELDALIDVGEKNISKKNIQVQAVNERAGFGGGSGGVSTVGKALHTGADAIRGGMKAVGSGAKTVAKKVGGVGSWLNSVADTAKQMRQGNWNGSFIFSPLGKALDVLGGAVSSDFAQALGVGAAAVSLVGSFPWLLGTAALGYGLWRFSNLKLGDGSNYVPSDGLYKRADGLKQRYVELSKRVSQSVAVGSSQDEDCRLMQDAADSDADKFNFDNVLRLVDVRGRYLDGDLNAINGGGDISGLEDRNRKICTFLAAVKKMSEKDAFKAMQDFQGVDAVNDSLKPLCGFFGDEERRLIFEASEAILTKQTVFDGVFEDEEGGNSNGGDFKREDIDKLFEQMLDAREKDLKECEAFFEKELFSRRRHALYYIPSVDGGVAPTDFRKMLNDNKLFDSQLKECFINFSADKPKESFDKVFEQMGKKAEGLYCVCLDKGENDADDNGKRQAIVCLKVQHSRGAERIEEMKKEVEKKSSELFAGIFSLQLSQLCAKIKFDAEKASTEFERFFKS